MQSVEISPGGKERSVFPASPFRYRSQLLAAQKAGKLMEPPRLRDLASPCLPSPCTQPLLREQLRSEAKEGGAQRSPGPLLLRGASTRTAAPPGHPSHFAQSSDSGRLLTLTRTPLQLFAKVPVPGCLGMGAELLRPQRQSLRLTSPGGGG